MIYFNSWAVVFQDDGKTIDLEERREPQSPPCMHSLLIQWGPVTNGAPVTLVTLKGWGHTPLADQSGELLNLEGCKYWWNCWGKWNLMLFVAFCWEIHIFNSWKKHSLGFGTYNIYMNKNTIQTHKTMGKNMKICLVIIIP